MQFKDRLKERMNQKSIDTKEFAKRLCNYGSDSDLWENNGHKNSYMRKIQKWLAGNSEPANIAELKKICDILDCDFSYLLGDSSIANLNNKKVAEYLGFDEIVVSKIKNYDRIIKLYMSLFIRANEYDAGGDILNDFIEKMILLGQNSSHTTVTIENDAWDTKELLRGEDAFNYILPAIKGMLEPIFYSVALLGVGINSEKYSNKLTEREMERNRKLDELLNDVAESTGLQKEKIMQQIKEKCSRNQK